MTVAILRTVAEGVEWYQRNDAFGCGDLQGCYIALSDDDRCLIAKGWNLIILVQRGEIFPDMAMLFSRPTQEDNCAPTQDSQEALR